MNVSKEQIFQMFQREKRYLYIVGLLIVFTRILNVDTKEIDVFGIIKADINNPENVNTVLGVFFVWFMYRFNVLGSKVWDEGEVSRLYRLAVLDSEVYVKWQIKKSEKHARALAGIMNVPEINRKSLKYVHVEGGGCSVFREYALDYCTVASGQDAHEYMSETFMYPSLYVRIVARLRGAYYVFNRYIGMSELVAPIIFICGVSLLIFIDGVFL